MKKSLLFILMLSNIGTFTIYGMQSNLLPLKTLSSRFIAQNCLTQNKDTSYEKFLNTYQRGILPKELIQYIWDEIIKHRFFEQNNGASKNTAIKAFSDSIKIFYRPCITSKPYQWFAIVDQKELEKGVVLDSQAFDHAEYKAGYYDNFSYQALAFSCNDFCTLFIAHDPLNCFFIIDCHFPFSTPDEFHSKQSDELKQILENQLTEAFRTHQVRIYQDRRQALRKFFEQLDRNEEIPPKNWWQRLLSFFTLK